MSEAEREERRRERAESRTASTYKGFLGRLRERASLEEGLAERGAASVLCVLEQRLIGEEAQDMEAQLPRKLRSLLQRCERHQGLPPRKFGRDALLRMVAEELGMEEPEVEPIVRAVFATVADHITAGEVEEVMRELPGDLRALWPPLEEVAARSAEERERGVRRQRRQRQAQRAGAGREAVQEMAERFLELPLAAQLGILRTVVPQALLHLDEAAREGFLRDLNEEVARGERGEAMYDVRHGEGAGLH